MGNSEVLICILLVYVNFWLKYVVLVSLCSIDFSSHSRRRNLSMNKIVASVTSAGIFL